MSIKLSNNNIDENAAVGSVIGKFSILQPNKGAEIIVQYTLKNNPLNTFRIEGLDLILNSSLNYAIISNYPITVKATSSGGQNISEDFNIKVIFVPQQPISIGIWPYFIQDNTIKGIIQNKSKINTQVGKLWTFSPDRYDTFTYKLVSGEGSTDNRLFKIEENENAYYLFTFTEIDKTRQSSYSVRLKSTDPNGFVLEQALQLIVGITTVETTLVDTPKVINFAPSDVFDQPITLTILQQPVYGKFVQTSDYTFTYTSNQNGWDYLVMIVQIGSSFTELSVTLFFNYSLADVSSIPKIQGTYTFDNISYNGNTWKFGTFTSNSPFIQYMSGLNNTYIILAPPVNQRKVSSTELGTIRFIHHASSDDVASNTIIINTIEQVIDITNLPGGDLDFVETGSCGDACSVASGDDINMDGSNDIVIGDGGEGGGN
jgi:hypothetical protein